MKTLLARVVATLLLAAACGAAFAQAGVPNVGREYRVLNPPRPVTTGPRIEVIEFFYYGCPVCYEAQPHIARWLMTTGSDVVLRRIPATTAESGEAFALTFYALESAGLLARLHWPLYDNHHFDDMRLHEEKNLLAWLGRSGVDAERFRALRNSADVKARVAAGQKVFELYDVRGVPTFAVDGKYITSATMARGVPQLMKVVEHLVGLARTDRRR